MQDEKKNAIQNDGTRSQIWYNMCQTTTKRAKLFLVSRRPVNRPVRVLERLQHFNKDLELVAPTVRHEIVRRPAVEKKKTHQPNGKHAPLSETKQNCVSFN